MQSSLVIKVGVLYVYQDEELSWAIDKQFQFISNVNVTYNSYIAKKLKN